VRENFKLLKPALNMMIIGFSVLMLMLTITTSALAVSPQVDAGGYHSDQLDKVLTGN
jgi:hypothetical protein